MVMVAEIGIEPEAIITRADLHPEVIEASNPTVTFEQYLAMFAAADAVAGGPALAIRLAEATSPELFSVPVFAAVCSPDLYVATQRLSDHKRLMAPIRLDHERHSGGLTVTWHIDADPTLDIPALFYAFELAMFVRIARIATRQRIVPIRVSCPIPLQPTEAFSAYFGREPDIDTSLSLTFADTDASRPFVTASESLWAGFRAELRRLTDAQQEDASMTSRTRSALQECLPSGRASVAHVAERVGVSRRTLQRRLAEEGATFRALLHTTREELADHYLTATHLPLAEIAFLLGFDEPSSFFRAFREWTGTTPQRCRAEAAM